MHNENTTRNLKLPKFYYLQKKLASHKGFSYTLYPAPETRKKRKGQM